MCQLYARMVLSYKSFSSTWIKKQDETRALRERKRNKKILRFYFFSAEF